MEEVKLRLGGQGHSISPELYGVFFEDQNFSCDGGINANMVNNFSFETVDDPIKHWDFHGGYLSKMEDKHEGSAYVRIRSEGRAKLKNLGYNGGMRYSRLPAMGIRRGHWYEFACDIRRRDFVGDLMIVATDRDDRELTDEITIPVPYGTDWMRLGGSLAGKLNGYGKLEIFFCGKGSLDIDRVSFMDRDYWNSDDPKWKEGRLRKDIVKAISDLHPAFMRFPSGSIINDPSKQIGCYQYFCLCEDLDMIPLPTYPAKNMNAKSAIIDDYLNLIAFATGRPDEGYWPNLRAKMGHPDPFPLDRVCIEHEDFEGIRREIQRHYVGMHCIRSNNIFTDTIEANGTLYSALRQAEYMIDLEKKGATAELSSYATLLHYAQSGMFRCSLISFNPLEVCRTANYHVERLFATNVGGTYLPYVGELPYKNFVSASMDRSVVYLKYINSSPEPSKVTVELPRKIVASWGEVLHDEDMYAKNKISFHEKDTEILGIRDFDHKIHGNELNFTARPYSIIAIRAEQK